jgi:hypothetical protein
MKQHSALTWLVPLIAVLALLAAGIGLFTANEGSQFSFTAVRGETVQIWGQGWYRYDTPIGALSFKAGDLITLFLAIPVLIVSFVLYRQGSMRGGLLLTGALAYFLYTYISLGFGATYNNLFVVYILIFSASLFGLILALTSFDLQSLPAHFAETLPRRATFLVVSGIILSLIWLALSISPHYSRARLPEPISINLLTGSFGIVAPAHPRRCIDPSLRHWLFAGIHHAYLPASWANLTAAGSSGGRRSDHHGKPWRSRSHS